MTLVEVAIALGVIGIMTAVAVPSFVSWRSDLRVKGAARAIGDLYGIARSEALRTRVSHIVYVWLDPQANPLLDGSGDRVAALLTRDANADGLPQGSEYLAHVPIENGLAWGVGLAGGAAPDDADPNNSYAGGWTFRDRNGATASWVVFREDGLPRGFKVGPYDDGGDDGIGTGSGGIYLSNGRRDYAVVVSPLGSVRMHRVDPASGQWQ